jgi:hypothetical protein
MEGDGFVVLVAVQQERAAAADEAGKAEAE